YSAGIFSDEARTGNHGPKLPERPLAREILHAAIGRDDEPLARNDGQRLPDPLCHDLGRLDLARAEVENSQHDRLVSDVPENLRLQARLRGRERQMARRAVVELTQERVATRAVVDDVRVAETGVEDRLTVDALQRTVDRLDGVLARRFRPGLEVRFVDLDDVRAGCLQVSQLLVDGLGVAQRQAAWVAVVIVPRLLRHRERPRNRDLDPAVCDRPEKLDVPDLDRPPAADRPDDSRDGILVTRAIERDAGMLEIEAVERGREAGRVALPARYDVPAGPLHVLNREPGRVVLGLFEERLWHAPELARSHPRRQPLPE